MKNMKNRKVKTFSRVELNVNLNFHRNKRVMYDSNVLINFQNHNYVP